MPKRICAFLILVTLLTVTNRAPAQLTAIKIGHNGFTDETVFYLGRDAGIFKKYGIHLELIYIPGGSLSVQALIGNSLDMIMRWTRAGIDVNQVDVNIDVLCAVGFID